MNHSFGDSFINVLGGENDDRNRGFLLSFFTSIYDGFETQLRTKISAKTPLLGALTSPKRCKLRLSGNLRFAKQPAVIGGMGFSVKH